jgi:hypothetical protein
MRLVPPIRVAPRVLARVMLIFFPQSVCTNTFLFIAVSDIILVNPVVPSSSVVAPGNTASQNAGITTAPEILDLDQEDLETAPVPTATVVTQVIAGAPIVPVNPVPTAIVVTQVAAGAPIVSVNPVPTPSNLPYIDSQSRRWYTVTRGIDVGVYADW